MGLEKFHEVESVQFVFPEPARIPYLADKLCSLGAMRHDDVLSFDRRDAIQPWQPSSWADVRFVLDENEIFGLDDGSCSALYLEYLFPWLPFEYANQFVRLAVEVGSLLGLTPIHRGAPVDLERLDEIFRLYRHDILTETGDEPGSDSVAIIIQSTYPRR